MISFMDFGLGFVSVVGFLFKQASLRSFIIQLDSFPPLIQTQLSLRNSLCFIW